MAVGVDASPSRLLAVSSVATRPEPSGEILSRNVAKAWEARRAGGWGGL